MSSEPEDIILDSCLEEVLGGHYPPDLSAKILQEWEAGRTAAGATPVPPPPTAVPVPPPVQKEADVPKPWVSPANGVSATPWNRSRRREVSWGIVATAAALLIAIAGGLWWFSAWGPERAPMASTEAGPTLERGPGTAGTGAVERERSQAPPRSLAERPSPDAIPSETPSATAPDAVPMLVEHPAAENPPRVAAPIPAPRPDAGLIALVGDSLRQAWREHSITPSPAAGDREWCVRVFDRLLGRAPSDEEVQAFLRDRGEDRRQRLVDELLASEEHDWRWAQIVTSALSGPRPAGSEPLTSRQALEDYILRSLAMDKPYDQLAYELLVASGANHPAAEDYNGAVNFLLSGAGDQALSATDRTARVFLGKQLVCAQCHDQASNQLAQEDFWQLNAFFRQMHVQTDPESGIARLTDRDFVGESGTGTDAEIFYRQADGRLKVAYPALGGQEVSHSGLLRDINRREELAELVVTSPDFRRAAVNRVWARLFGYGFTQPVDDMGPHNPPSHPELLAELGDQFAAHGYDLDRLIRWLVLSEPFGLSGKPMPESWMDAPEVGSRPLFARFYQAPPDDADLYRSMLAAVNARPAIGVRANGTYARRAAFAFGPGPLSIIDAQPQERIAGPAWLAKLAASSLAPEMKIQHVFLSVLGRAPESRELKAAKLLLADRMNDAIALPEVWQLLVAQRRFQASTL